MIPWRMPGLKAETLSLTRRRYCCAWLSLSFQVVQFVAKLSEPFGQSSAAIEYALSEQIRCLMPARSRTSIGFFPRPDPKIGIESRILGFIFKRTFDVPAGAGNAARDISDTATLCLPGCQPSSRPRTHLSRHCTQAWTVLRIALMTDSNTMGTPRDRDRVGRSGPGVWRISSNGKYRHCPRAGPTGH